MASNARERSDKLSLLARLQANYPELPDAPYPDEIDNRYVEAYLKTSHDLGGEPDAPIEYIEKEDEAWEHNTYIDCEVLGWRGIWVSEERRRIHNVDLGRSAYLGLPYYGRWLLGIGRILVDKKHMTLFEISERFEEVKKRYATEGTDKVLAPRPKTISDGSDVKRNEHHIHAVGKGDPQVYEGKAAPAKFAVGDEVVVRDMQAFYYTRTQEYVRGVKGVIASVSYESPAAEDEAFDMLDAQPEWFYIVRFRQTDLWPDYTGSPKDSLQTEIPERWLEPAASTDN